ncbi:MAG: FG-GAP repeat protein [Proteobacteria bacterium]|nr:FG-GAP repeat protein [Pseudomonadota bacterium]
MMKTKLSIMVCLAGLLGASVPAFAQQPAANANAAWNLEPGRVVGGSSNESGARLMDPVVLDFDGDGVDDIIFGAPGTNPNGISSAGCVYVIRGKKDLIQNGKVDVTSWTSFDYRFDGHIANGLLGMNLMTGDFNGDGKKDLLIAEPGGMGTVYLLYGGKKRDKGIYDIMQNGGADVSFTTTESGTNLGLSGCIGDFNRDGMDDLALAYISHSATLGNNTSHVVLMAMRREWDKKVYDITGKIYGKTTLSRPVSTSSRVLHSCAVGDFNDDNIPDIALGMPMDAYQKQKMSGSVTIVYHPYKYNGTNVDLSKVDEKVGIRINGNQPNAQFGYSLAAGDFTGDGRDDLAVSAPNRLVKGPNSEGAVYIYDANHWPKETCEQPDTLKLVGKGGLFGYRLQSVDVNGDKRPDLVISAPYSGQTSDGALMAYLGGPHFVETLEGNQRADIELTGSDFMGFGLGAGFGDLNNDGKIDAVVRTAADPMQRANTGAFAVIGDYQDMPQTSSLGEEFLTIAAPGKGGGLSAQNKIVDYQGKRYRAWFSQKGMGNRSVICLVDATRPMQSDIPVVSSESCDVQIVGPENYDIYDFVFGKSPTGKPTLTISVPYMPVKKSTGFVAVIELPESITQPLVLNLNENTLKTSAQTFLLSGESAAVLGYRLEWNDLDKDGYEELIIGAPKRKVDQDTGGTVFVVKGKLDREPGFYELVSSDVIQYEGFANEELGTQWQVLDINRDNELDLLVRAAHTPDSSGEEYATVYGIYSAGYRDPKAYNVKSPTLASLKIIAAQNRAGLEIIPQSIDITQDGADDLVLISPDYRAGLQKQGIVYVVAAGADKKGGDLRLDAETHSVFSFTTGRNEKLVDARFVRMNSKLLFVTVTSDIQTGLSSTVNAFVEKSGSYQGQYTESKLTRVISEGKMTKPMRLMLEQDPNKAQDELWFVFPFDGVSQSGQGTAQKVRRF